MTNAAGFIPYALLSVCFLGVSLALLHLIPPFRNMFRDKRADRYAELDGLRGFLALGVFFHHCVIYYFYFQTGVWTKPPSILYSFLGEGCVKFFFMITGFLFWRKAISAHGSISPIELVLGRLFRLFPLYLFVVLVVVLIVFVETQFRINVPLATLASHISQWILFCPLGQPDINGIDAPFITARVFWTLWYEWSFYLALPFVAKLWKPERFAILAAVILFLHALGVPFTNTPFLTFIYGMLAAYSIQTPWSRGISSSSAARVLTLLLILIPFMPNNVFRDLAMLSVFIAIVNGNSFFGLLTCRSARLLGTISYGIYLLHPLVLYMGMNASHSLDPHRYKLPYWFWLNVSLFGTIMIPLCALTYRLFEEPFMHRTQLISHIAEALRRISVFTLMQTVPPHSACKQDMDPITASDSRPHQTRPHNQQ